MYEYPSFNPVLVIFWLAVMVLLVVSDWKIFVKAGKPGWAILVPIYNIIVMLQIVKKPLWWIVLLIVPLVNIAVVVIIVYNLVIKFGQPGWHVIPALILGCVYFPYLAFSKAQYNG